MLTAVALAEASASERRRENRREGIVGAGAPVDPVSPILGQRDQLPNASRTSNRPDMGELVRAAHDDAFPVRQRRCGKRPFVDRPADCARRVTIFLHTFLSHLRYRMGKSLLIALVEYGSDCLGQQAVGLRRREQTSIRCELRDKILGIGRPRETLHPRK